MLPRPLAYVLGGGGSLGAAQVGMLQALGEHDLSPDLVVGTSVGSLNGAVVALEPRSAANRLAHAWAHVTADAVLPGGVLGQARTLGRSKSYLFPNDGLAEVIGHFLGDVESFDELGLPFGAVTTDVATTAARVIRTGRLVPALVASCAIPGVYPTVAVEGARLYDGGVVANVPMRQALDMGARSLVVLDCNFPGRLPEPPQTLPEVLLFALMAAMRSQAALEAPRAAVEVPVVYLPGPPWRAMSPLDFGHTARLIEDAYDVCAAFLKTLEVDGPGLYGAPAPREARTGRD